MKLFLVLVFAALCVEKAAAANVQLSEEEISDYIQSCLAKTRLSQAFFRSSDKARKNLSLEQKSCFMACMFKKTKIIKDDGSVSLVDSDDVDPISTNEINECTTIANGDVCKLAWCLFKTNKFHIDVVHKRPRYA